MKGNTKKHDLEHDICHEEEYQKARFLARGRAPKRAILCTMENMKKMRSRARYLDKKKIIYIYRIILKNIILGTKENTRIRFLTQRKI